MDRDELILSGRAWVVTDGVSAEALLHRLAESAPAEDTILLATGLVGDGPNAAGAAGALQGHGIQAVIAPRFAWSFFRACLTIGLPPLTLWEAAEIRPHDRLRIDVSDLIVKDLSAGTRYPIRDLSDLYIDILSCGGGDGYGRALRAARLDSG